MLYFIAVVAALLNRASTIITMLKYGLETMMVLNYVNFMTQSALAMPVYLAAHHSLCWLRSKPCRDFVLVKFWPGTDLEKQNIKANYQHYNDDWLQSGDLFGGASTNNPDNTGTLDDDDDASESDTLVPSNAGAFADLNDFQDHEDVEAEDVPEGHNGVEDFEAAEPEEIQENDKFSCDDSQKNGEVKQWAENRDLQDGAGLKQWANSGDLRDGASLTQWAESGKLRDSDSSSAPNHTSVNLVPSYTNDLREFGDCEAIESSSADFVPSKYNICWDQPKRNEKFRSMLATINETPICTSHSDDEEHETAWNAILDKYNNETDETLIGTHSDTKLSPSGASTPDVKEQRDKFAEVIERLKQFDLEWERKIKDSDLEPIPPLQLIPDQPSMADIADYHNSEYLSTTSHVSIGSIKIVSRRRPSLKKRIIKLFGCCFRSNIIAQ